MKKILLSGCFFLLIPLNSFAEVDIYFAYGKDSPPISQEEAGRFIDGTYCKALSKHLEDKDFKLKYLPMGIHQRLEGISEKSVFYEELNKNPSHDKTKIIFIECSSTTKTPKREKNLKDGVNEDGEDIGIKGRFTDIFHETKGKILIDKALYERIKYDQLEIDGKLKIGIIGKFDDEDRYENNNSCSLESGEESANTNITTSSFVKSVFRNASFLPVVDRYDAFSCLKSGDIDAFANDEVLLPYILEKLEKAARDEKLFDKEFLIIPDIGGYTNEAYSVVVYGDNDEKIIKIINRWINGEESTDKLEESIVKFSSYRSRYGYGTNEDGQIYFFFNRPIWIYLYGLLAISLLTALVLFFVFIIRENRAKKAISRKEFQILSENVKKINSKLSRVDFKSSIALKEAVAFISYSREDMDRVTNVAEELEQQGYSVWLDKKFVIGGDDFVERIKEGISSTKVTILFCSINSVKSRWVIKEAEITREKGNIIIPVMLDSDEEIIKSSKSFSEELKLGYTQKIYMRSKKEENAALTKIIESIDHNLKEKNT